MFIYLASPYTIKVPMSVSQAVKAREERFKRICRTAADLMDRGYEVFSPIAHSHPIEVHGMTDIRNGDFWLKQDFAVLKFADVMVIDDTIEGWDNSDGIARETEFCFENGIPVEFLSEQTGGVKNGTTS